MRRGWDGCWVVLLVVCLVLGAAGTVVHIWGLFR